MEGTGLLARCLCHEIDHLDGIMYTTKVEGELFDTAQPEDVIDEDPVGDVMNGNIGDEQ